jgi:hypothetical protein
MLTSSVEKLPIQMYEDEKENIPPKGSAFTPSRPLATSLGVSTRSPLTPLVRAPSSRIMQDTPRPEFPRATAHHAPQATPSPSSKIGNVVRSLFKGTSGKHKKDDKEVQELLEEMREGFTRIMQDEIATLRTQRENDLNQISLLREKVNLLERQVNADRDEVNQLRQQVNSLLNDKERSPRLFKRERPIGSNENM